MNAPNCPFKDVCNGKCGLAEGYVVPSADYRPYKRYVPVADYCRYKSKCLCYRSAMAEKERQQKPTDPNEYEDREEHARDVWPY